MLRSSISKTLFASLMLLTVMAPVFTVAAYTIQKFEVEEANDFSIEPARQEIFVKPGETVTKYISVTSRINRPIKYATEIEDMVGSQDPSDKRAVILLADKKGPYSLADYIKPEVENFELNFGERITFAVDITVPPEMEPGGLFGAILVSNRPTVEEDAAGLDGSVTQTISRIGALFLVRVEGDAETSGALKDFKTIGEKRSIYENGPDGFEILFENTGNVHLVPYGQVAIKNLFGRTVGSIPVDAYFALPDALRYREVKWENKPLFMLGRYEAELSLNRGYGDIVDTSTVAFWVLPWKVLIVVFLLIVTISILFYFITSKFEIKRKDISIE